MRETDTYKTIGNKSSGLYKDKGSKFIALAFPVHSEEEVKERLEEVKKQYYDARHHCYAYVIGYEGDRFRYNDDGEPSGTAGKPIHGQILSHELCNILVVVVRYFGGTKLGVRGLINAYKGAAKEAILQNTILTKTIRSHYQVAFQYPAMNDVMRVMKEQELVQHVQDFDLHCRIEFSVRKTRARKAVSQLEEMPHVKLTYLYTK